MYEHKIAFRSVIAKKRNTFFAVLAVALAVGIIILFMGMISGFAAEMIDATVESSPHITVDPEDDDDEYIHLYDHFNAIIRQTEGVLFASPVLVQPTAMEHRDNTAGIVLEGIDPRSEIDTMRVDRHLLKGNFTALERSYRGVVLGSILAEDLDVGIGEKVDLVKPNGETASLEVIAIISTGTPKDETLAYARLDLVQDFYDRRGQVSHFKVRVADIHQADKIAADIQRDTGLEAISWMEANKDLLDLINTQQVVAWIFYLMIFIVAGFGIANTLYTMVIDRKKEIGMLMAMGASRKSISIIFLIESALLGIAGVLLGFLIAFIGAYFFSLYEIDLPADVYYGVSTIPIDMQTRFFVYSGGFSLLINMIAASIPAKQAAQMDPVEAIEEE